MNDFDSKLRKKAQEDSKELPKIAKDAIESALADLPNTPPKRNLRLIFSRVAVAAASFIFVFLCLLPNVSVAYAKTLEEVPVLGKIVHVVTIRNYFLEEENHDLDVKVPQVEGGDSQAADALNTDADALTTALVKQFYNDLAENGGSGFGSLHVDYEKIADTDAWFTLKLDVTETAASSNHYYKYYHMDKVKDAVITLQDLFVDDSYRAILKAEIHRQIDLQLQEDPSKSYFVSEADFGTDFAELQPDHNFYWNANGDLVIPFDKYEIAPGSMGNPEFVISKSLLQDCLKEEYKNLKF